MAKVVPTDNIMPDVFHETIAFWGMADDTSGK